MEGGRPNGGNSEFRWRLERIEQDVNLLRDRFHNLANSVAELNLVKLMVEDIEEQCKLVPVLEERIRNLTDEVKGLRRAFIGFTFSVLGGAILFLLAGTFNLIGGP